LGSTGAGRARDARGAGGRATEARDADAAHTTTAGRAVIREIVDVDRFTDRATADDERGRKHDRYAQGATRHDDQRPTGNYVGEWPLDV
jgi:hypothetical protein